MTWLYLLIAVIIVGALLGFIFARGGKRVEGAVVGGVAAGSGCLYLLIKIFLAGLFIFLILWLFKVLFGISF